jgi:tetratricopeptide (TPR) repeat protein
MIEDNNKESRPALEFPPELKTRAQEFFTKASEVAYALQYDYAIELYLDGLSFWPEAINAGHKALREIALRRQAAGGKKSGFGDGSKYKKASSKHPKDAMLKAEYLLSKDPANQCHMADMVKAAVEAGYLQTAHWMADMLFDANMRSGKPAFQTYIFLRDIYTRLETYPRALQACQLAQQLKPDEDSLADVLRDLSAQATMQQGKYEDGSDFRDSIKNRDAQEKLQSQEQTVRSGAVLKDAIVQARAEYQAQPDAHDKIEKLVKALCDTENTESENEAIEILEKSYVRLKQFSYKQRSGEISMKQMRRKIRQLQEAIKKNPQDKELDEQLNQASSQASQAELDHYKLCVENYPTDKRLKYEYGKCLLHGKKFDEAIPMFQEARNDPRHKIPALNAIGQCFFYKQWYPDAVESFQQAFDLLDNKEDALGKELLYNLGRAYEADGQTEKALNCYRRVAQIDFNYRDARSRVDSLRKQ